MNSFTFEEYEPLRFEAPGTRADGLVLAFDEADVVGLCQLTCPPGRRWAFIEMTGSADRVPSPTHRHINEAASPARREILELR